ncbi:histidine phosphatase family protein [Priestia megaterium]|uniref:histidine phosphatase family protein n=1 Tax=Priestia megaterium TaxID=1404 RepID=UPI0018A0A79E|nr:histidine phosphatase family protein [Priestia megaterium]
MKVALVRHYKVNKGLPENNRLSTDELVTWFQEYDESDITYGETDLNNIEWKRCFSSDMPRAHKTAKHIYKQEITLLPELREIPMPIIPVKFKLPFILWALLFRMSGLINKQARKDMAETKRKVAAVLDRAISESEDDLLIVSHGGIMKFMRKELIKRGFKGPRFDIAVNGKLYLFEKQ